MKTRAIIRSDSFTHRAQPVFEDAAESRKIAYIIYD
jgi:hypothetical protein